MKEQYLETQQYLISILLTYPTQASKVLSTHQKLIDRNFVRLIEQVAAKMMSYGNHQAAYFLQDVAGQIKRHFLSGVLQVGEETITASEIIPRLTKYKMLPQFLSEIIVDRAIASVNCTPEEKFFALEQFKQQQQITEDTELQAWCQRNNLTPSELETFALRPLKIRKFQEEKWGHRLESYFLERKNQLDQVSYSLIRLKDGGAAREIYHRLTEEEQSFSELSREYSQGAEARNGGLIGPMPMDMPHPHIAKMLKLSQPGQLLPPTQVGEWIVIIRLEKLIPAQLDDRMRWRLLHELFNNWLSKQLNTVKIDLSLQQQEQEVDNPLPSLPMSANLLPTS